MRVPLYNSLRRLDRHWILNRPLLWIMRLNWMVYFGALGLIPICLVALVLPVSLGSARSLGTYFWSALVLAGLAVSPWIYLQARIAPQLRQNTQARTAAYLLAGYLFILGIFLVWPYAFVHILEVRISSKISSSDLLDDYEEFKEIRWAFSTREVSNLLPPDLPTRILALQNKYQLTNIEQSHQTVDTTAVDIDLIFKSIEPILRIKIYNRHPHAYYNYWEAASQIVLLLTLFLRFFQETDAKGMLATLFAGVIIFIVLAICFSFKEMSTDLIIFGTLISLLSTGLYATFRAPRLKQKSIFPAVGMNIFTLLLAWTPFLLVAIGGEVFALDFALNDSLVYSLFLIGIIILFALTPWIQRSYLALQSKPS